MCKGIYNSDTLYGNMDLSLPSQFFSLSHPHPYFFSYFYPLTLTWPTVTLMFCTPTFTHWHI